MEDTKTKMTQEEKAQKIREWLESGSYNPLFQHGLFRGERIFVRVPATKSRRFDYVYCPKSVDGTETGVTFFNATFKPVLIWDNVDKVAFNIDGAVLGIIGNDATILGTKDNPKFTAALEEVKAILNVNIARAVKAGSVPEQFRSCLESARGWNNISAFIKYSDYLAWYDDVILADINEVVRWRTYHDAEILSAVEDPSGYAAREANRIMETGRYGGLLGKALAVHEFFSDVMDDKHTEYPRDTALMMRSMYAAVKDLPDNMETVLITLKEEAGGGSYSVPVNDLVSIVGNCWPLWCIKKILSGYYPADICTITYGCKILWEATDSENDN